MNGLLFIAGSGGSDHEGIGPALARPHASRRRCVTPRLQRLAGRARCARHVQRSTLRRERRSAMPPKAWSDKRERQYEHIKESYEDRGRSEDKAEEIAARTVNKQRRESGEAKSKKD